MADEEIKEEQAGADKGVKVAEVADDEEANGVDGGDEQVDAAQGGEGEDKAGSSEGGAAEASEAAAMEVHPSDLPELRQTRGADSAGGHIDMVLDVSVPIMVELGRTRMLVRDILNLGVGGVVELDKAAGEPVEVYVRDMKFASGEVVVVGDRFGVRIKEIFDPRAEKGK